MPDLVGHTLGQYRIVEQIGIGGMATVYKAYQPSLDRYVAIKILPAYYAHEPGFAERFTREAKAVAKLTHPHVLPIYDFGQEDGLSYIVMQHVDSGTLKGMLGQPISLMTAADIIEQIADALDCAHEQGIIHRDVKPSNVLMDRGHWALLSDFGLAKMVEGSVQLTGSGVGVGTPAYMAPEQGQGLKVNRRADIYSLGIILYEMVTGQIPFDAETPMAIVVKHITEPLPLPRKINPDVPESVERIIMKALAKNPEDRYETAGKMAAALRKAVARLDTGRAEAMPSPPTGAAGAIGAPTILEEGGATQVVPPPVTATASERKGLPIWAVAAGIALLLVLLAVGALVVMRLLITARQAAIADRQTATDQAVVVATPSDTGAAVTPPDTAPPTKPLPPETPSLSPEGPIIMRALAFMEQNPPIFKDDFNNPDSGWGIVNDRQGQEGRYEDGAYVIRVPEIAGQEATASVPLPLDKPLADFILKFDLVTTEGGPGANWAVGLRAEAKTSLYAGLSTQPRGFRIGLVDSGKETTLSRGLAPNYRPDDVTQVMLLAMGPNIVLYLDDMPVGIARTDLTQPGRLLFSIINTSDPIVAYRLDNVVVWDLSASAGPPKVSREMPIFEDFEDGQADGWGLEPGWKVAQEEDGNHVLQAEKHSFATHKDGKWGDFLLSFRVKSLNGDFHLNIRADPGDPGRTRYMAHLMPEAVVFHKVQAGRSPAVADAPLAYTTDQWHRVEVVAQGGHIEILVDGQPVLTYDDPDPLPPGTIAFENGDPPARHLIDDVVIEPAKP